MYDLMPRTLQTNPTCTSMLYPVIQLTHFLTTFAGEVVCALKYQACIA
jgi:hypothetical protein